MVSFQMDSQNNIKNKNNRFQKKENFTFHHCPRPPHAPDSNQEDVQWAKQ